MEQRVGQNGEGTLQVRLNIGQFREVNHVLQNLADNHDLALDGL